jgi:Leucine-rich repeat (LRR) protein
MRTPVRFLPGIVMAGMVIGLIGCDESPTSISVADHARRAAEEDSTTLQLTPEELRRKLNANEMATFLVSGNDIVEANLFRSGVRSIEPLRGMPLRGLDLGFTRVTDLSPLEGMKLELLVLENVPVSDITVIRGMPLKILKLQNSKVTDFSVLQGMALEQLNVLNLPFSDLSLVKDMPLEILWLTGTQITDLSDIPSRRLVSLDIERTSVNSLDPLATVNSLRRLNIANTPISDVTPLKNLRLERIVLSPERIRTGMETLRSIKSLVLIQTSIEEELSADDFWKRYDLGVWKQEE